MFANELSDRLKVIACLERPNMSHSEAFENGSSGSQFRLPVLIKDDWAKVRKLLKAGPDDAQVVFRGPEADVATALDTIAERCRLAFDGVPFETRKSFSDGTTIFERVLPGADRMYPDTDSAPIPIEENEIEEIAGDLPVAVDYRLKQLKEWGVPEDTYNYLLRRNLVWIIEKIADDFDQPARFVGTLFGHTLRHFETRVTPAATFKYYTIYGLFKFLAGNGLDRLIAREMINELYAHPKMVFESVLTAIGYKKHSQKDILSHLPDLKKKFAEIRKSDRPEAQIDWIMGHLRKIAIGNVPLDELRAEVARGIKA
ncbi:MAG: hypothetical protein GY841_01615 [FCB group bacterium]|nr:hypothetical protein [FCB group bacterium]